MKSKIISISEVHGEYPGSVDVDVGFRRESGDYESIQVQVVLNDRIIQSDGTTDKEEVDLQVVARIEVIEAEEAGRIETFTPNEPRRRFHRRQA